MDVLLSKKKDNILLHIICRITLKLFIAENL
jgi:hypothetical protein